MFNEFIGNIESITINNTNYREVLYTSKDKNTQLVVMSLKPKQEIGLEMHDHVNQFFRIEKGTGKAVLGKNNEVTHELKDGSSLIVPAGTWHNIINISDTDDLKLYTIYNPANHPDKLIQKIQVQDGGYYAKYRKYKSKYLNLKN
jgi:mannose-6-phosphate isomerase-like protein (cupin superfamily)